MDLFNKLSNDPELIERFCDILEEFIDSTAKHVVPYLSGVENVDITYRIGDTSIFFFIGGSSILQIMPDKELQYTYAHVPGYGEEVKKSIYRISLQINRDEKLEEILGIKKES